jgi:integrase
MPSIEPRRNQNGIVTSYRLIVSGGLDREGKQIKRRMLWIPPNRNISDQQMLKEATAAAYKFEEQIKNGYVLDNTQTFSEYAQYVLEMKERIGVKTSTLDRYIDMLPRINEAIGNLKLCNIRPQHLNDFYKDMTENAIREDSCRAIAKRNLMTQFKRAAISKAELSRRAGVAASTITAATTGKPLRLASADAIAEALGYTRKELFTVQNDPTPLAKKTILEHHRLISTILSQADKELLIPYNPASKATPPRVQRKTPDYYQPDEMNDILNTLEKVPIKWKAITYLLIDTGCRRGEIMGLKWDKVNFDTGVIVIDCNLLYSANRGVYEDTTKTGAVRAIKIAPQTLTVLRQWRVEYEHLQELNGDRWAGTPYVFVRDDGSRMHPDSITAWLNRFSAQNDLPHIHPHAFRHTAASTMIANGVDLVTTAAELGHANANTTATIYAHQIAIARATAADVRAGVFAGRK